MNNLSNNLMLELLRAFGPYLDPKSPSIYRTRMLERGIHVDECIKIAVKLNDIPIICDAIKLGYGGSYYQEWSNHSNECVRKTLAQCGHFPDVFIQDSSADVRVAVVKADPQYAKYLLHATTFSELSTLMWNYLNQMEPNIDEIRTLVENPHIDDPVMWNQLDRGREVLRAKIETFNIQLSTIEKTMSVVQLFMAQSEGWKRSVSAIQLRDMTTYEQQLRARPDCEAFLIEYLYSDKNISLDKLYR